MEGPVKKSKHLPFIELCAGSAAVSLALFGAKPPVSYAGNKQGYAKHILDAFGCSASTISEVILVEPGHWGATWNVLVDPVKRTETATRIRAVAALDAKTVWENSKSEMTEGSSDVIRCAAHLLTIAGTHGGFEKGGFKGKHKSRPSVDGFIPNRESLSKRVDELIFPKPVRTVVGRAEDVEPREAFCYIDPPYQSTTGYANKLDRATVVEIALRWAQCGARVVVSEACPIDELIAVGWSSTDLTDQRKGQLRKNSKSSSEYITFNF